MKLTLIIIAVIVIGLASMSVSAANFTVDTIVDNASLTACTAAANDCSLRGAILAANATLANDTIDFDPVVFATPQTIVLNGGDDLVTVAITVGGTLTINGPGADKLTIDANHETRVFSVVVNSDLTINGVTLTGGVGTSPTVSSGAGGAIYVASSNITINNSVVTGNAASGSSAGGGMFVTSSNPVSVVNIFNSTFSNNTAAVNGAVQLNATSTLVNSTFSGNTTNSTSVSNAGGVRHLQGTFTMVNCTITNNTAVYPTAGAGGFFRGSTGTVFLRNNIIAGNTSPFSADVAGAMTSLGNNLIGSVTSASSGWIGTDLINQSANLGTLRVNGGTTPTHRPFAGSPAIDVGDDCVTTNSCASNNLSASLSTDQLNQPRRVNGGTSLHIDIGAFEVQQPTASVGGSVNSSSGKFIGRATVVLTNPSTGGQWTAITSPFGYFRFDNVPTSENYTIAVLSKQYAFPTQSLQLFQDVSSLNIVSLP